MITDKNDNNEKTLLESHKAKPVAFRIVEASFIISAPDLAHCPEVTGSEIAIAGRSNVGKSSLINLICNRNQLAKTSNRPGKTRLLNYFLLRIEPQNQPLYLVDLPGYGYSSAGKSMQELWGKTVEEFLRKRQSLVGIMHLIDSRHPPTALDLQMREWIVHYKIPAVTILTKVDKLNKNAVQRTRNEIMQVLELNQNEAYILSSVPEKRGVSEIIAAMVNLLSRHLNSSQSVE